MFSMVEGDIAFPKIVLETMRKFRVSYDVNTIRPPVLSEMTSVNAGDSQPLSSNCPLLLSRLARAFRSMVKG
jgi:hypothetical protein